MVVECQILLTAPKEGIYKSGDAVTGSLVYSIQKPTVFESIFVFLTCKGKCYWSEGAGKNRRSYSGKEKYVSIQHFLVSEESLVEEGDYKHLFEFFLPKNLPSSFKDYICTISYKVKGVFIKPGLFGTKKFETEIPFYGDVNPTLAQPIIFGLTKCPFSLFTTEGPVDLKIEVEKTFLMPGENIKFKGTITNNSDTPVTGIRSRLVTEITYISDTKHKKIVRTTIKESVVETPGVEEDSEFSFKCVVPTLPNLYTIQHSEILIREYKLNVEVKLPFPHRDASAEIPVVIGEQGKLEEENASCSQTQEKDNEKDYERDFGVS